MDVKSETAWSHGQLEQLNQVDSAEDWVVEATLKEKHGRRVRCPSILWLDGVFTFKPGNGLFWLAYNQMGRREEGRKEEEDSSWPLLLVVYQSDVYSPKVAQEELSSDQLAGREQ